MSNFCGISGNRLKLKNQGDFRESINPAGNLTIESCSDNELFGAVSFFKQGKQTSPRLFENERVKCLYAGNLINSELLQWETLVEDILNSDFHRILQLRGYFAFAIYDKTQKKLYLVNDQLSQLPVYFGKFGGYLVFSTLLSTFSMLDPVPAFKKEWLYEYVFFNYPVGKLTPFSGVFRLPPASVLEYTVDSGALDSRRYAEAFERKEVLMKGRQALDHSVALLCEVIPRYYSMDGLNLHAMTGGLDTIMSLSQAPEHARVETYTYGVPGSMDFYEVRKRRKKLSYPHREILFDSAFTDQLGELIYETVRLSGGMQSINRTSLLYAYRSLTKGRTEAPFILSGIMADGLFRGHAGVPNLYPTHVEGWFKTGKISSRIDPFLLMFKEDLEGFASQVDGSIRSIRERYGDPTDPFCHLAFDSIETGPRYYNGELNLANSFGAFRTPFFDIDLVKLAYSSELGKLKYSALLNHKIDPFRKNMLHAEVISKSSAFRDIDYSLIPLKYWRSRNSLSIRAGRLLQRAYTRYVRNRQHFAPLENWELWFRQDLDLELARLLDGDSRISQFIHPDFIRDVRNRSDSFWLSKLATLEILIGLMQNRWQFK